MLHLRESVTNIFVRPLTHIKFDIPEIQNLQRCPAWTIYGDTDHD